MAPHVEVGKKIIHRCAQCKEKVHTFCVSKNDDGVMLCAGCDPIHSYGDSIQLCHQVDKEWRSKLLQYYNERDGIPGNMAFLAGEGYLAQQTMAKQLTERKTRTSSQAAIAINEVGKTKKVTGKRSRKKPNNTTVQRKLRRKRVS